MKQRLLRKIYWISAILAVVILVFLTSVIFLHPSSVGNPRFVWNITFWAVFWALNFILVLVLSFILARSLIKLFFEYQADRPGSRIKSKLVTTLIIFSLFPALIMAFLAFGLINQNLRQWFSSPSEQLLESSQVIARSYYERNRLLQLATAQLLARRVKAGKLETAGHFEDLRAEYGFDGVLLFDGQGQIVFQAGKWPGDQPLESAVEQVLRGEKYYTLERRIRLGDSESIVDHGIVGVPIHDTSSSVRGALFAEFVIPDSVAFHAIQVDEASNQYEAIKEGVNQLELNYFSVLGLTTLAVVFGFVWLGTYIAKKITVPLEALAEGSRELAEGNLDHRVDVTAVDELGILVDSFNRMAEEIKQSRQKLEKANAEMRETNVQLDERRRYIETILHNIATGVISIDESDVIRAVNEAALKVLQVNRENILNRSIREVADADLYREFLNMKKRARLYGTYRKEVTFRRGEQELRVAATITSNPLPFQQEVEYLIVLDDLTELIKAEKFAAWQEVAQRLAHEIKNPLTPIQLSAERVEKRFKKVAAARSSKEIREFQKLLGEAMRIIVAEAEMLKTLVEEFSRFARLPICKPVELQLHRLIEQTLTLYDGDLEKVQIKKVFDPKIEKVKMDPEQMQRVFINLIDNSLDALAESEADRYILILTQFNKGHESVTIEFQDNGIGISPQDYEHLFLPYFSTKKKGTGLGLAIVRQIVSEHNGFVRAEPNYPTGTRFIVELPVS
ncbi:ATP-binding protein [Acidobacteria bacterium AH-259-O06]|nr:ATP-binding protein [Acidobacteria bacterium AH-259-O06]